MPEYAQWIIAISLVCLHAQQRFNTPQSNVVSTTRVRYYLSITLYFASLGLLLILLGGGLTVSPALFVMFTQGGEQLSKDIVEQLPGPLLAALLLTALLPNFPALSKVDEWLRKSTWNIGNIPREARQLSARMRDSRFEVPDDFRTPIRNELGGFDDLDLQFEPFADEKDDTLQHVWTKITALYLVTRDWRENQVRNWIEKRKYDTIVEKLNEDFNANGKEYRRIKNMALSSFNLLRNSETLPDKTARAHIEENFRDASQHLHRRLCRFVARGVLRCELTKADRYEKLEEIGFKNIQDERQPLTLNDILGVGFAVFAALFIGMMIGSTIFMDLETIRFGKVLTRAVMVAIIYCLAIAIAIYPKTAWSFADITKIGSRPWFAYILSAALAVLAAMGVMLTFRFIIDQDFIKGLEAIYWSRPWFILTAVTAFSLAFLSDNYALKEDPPPNYFRWVEGLVMGGILSITSVFVFFWLTQVKKTPTNEVRDWLVDKVSPDWFQVPKWFVLIPVTFIIGFLIGAWVPDRYRADPSLPYEKEGDENENEKENEEA